MLDFHTSTKHIISLPARSDRREVLLPWLDENEMGLYQVWNAIDGHATDYSGQLKKGAYGCKLSHLMVIQHAIDKQLPYIIILEDDCQFKPEFAQNWEQVEAQIPKNWDIFYLGANHRLPPRSINTHICRCVRAFSTVAYVVRNTQYEYVMAKALEHDIEIDLIYADYLSHHGNVYAAVPNLVQQASGHSDIEGFTVDYSIYY